MTLKEMRQAHRAGLLNVKRGTFKCEGEMNGHMLNYGLVFGNVSERRDSKCCEVLMKHFHFHYLGHRSNMDILK